MLGAGGGHVGGGWLVSVACGPCGEERSAATAGHSPAPTRPLVCAPWCALTWCDPQSSVQWCRPPPTARRPPCPCSLNWPTRLPRRPNPVVRLLPRPPSPPPPPKATLPALPESTSWTTLAGRCVVSLRARQYCYILPSLPLPIHAAPTLPTTSNFASQYLLSSMAAPGNPVSPTPSTPARGPPAHVTPQCRPRGAPNPEPRDPHL
ncbi:hypothetical protein E2C01_052160 [Portunus trituberculatus]|uniref:Uncharacterized protein n=1 Tax=Portunus trituberculatus TaxID=210409 RepID=A0A5B7GL63_PORTR|nr:hypothetical protein [Portunus trituberculatus]